MCIEMLRPHGKPPWVGGLLFVEDIKCVRGASKDSQTEHNNKTCKNGLRETKWCWVDLHVDGFMIMFLSDGRCSIADSGSAGTYGNADA